MLLHYYYYYTAIITTTATPTNSTTITANTSSNNILPCYKLALSYLWILLDSSNIVSRNSLIQMKCAESCWMLRGRANSVTSCNISL